MTAYNSGNSVGERGFTVISTLARRTLVGL